MPALFSIKTHLLNQTYIKEQLLNKGNCIDQLYVNSLFISYHNIISKNLFLLRKSFITKASINKLPRIYQLIAKQTKQMQIQPKYDVIIIGGGVYGLSIAYYLSKNEDLKIALLQQYTIGHNKGSSHSTTRITRSLYEKQVYRDLNLQCLQKNWPEMEKVLGQKLVYANEFVYFNDDEQSYKNYRKVAQQQPKQNVKICQNTNQYKQYFKGRKHPQINCKYPPIIEKKAGIIYASLYMKKLKQHLSTNCQNISLMEHTFVKAINENKKQLSIQTHTQILRTNKVILAAGKWIKQLAPEVGDLFTDIKQFMAFLELENQDEFIVGKYPSFVHQQKNGKLFYSVPGDTTQRLGVKLGEHRLNQPLHPDAIENTIDYNYEQLRKKALQYFGEDLVRVKNVQECIYTNTKSNDFVIDWVGESEKILMCACCSGHGFKFAPLIGEIISQIISFSESDQETLQNKTKNGIYEKWKHMFKIAYHQGMNLY